MSKGKLDSRLKVEASKKEDSKSFLLGNEGPDRVIKVQDRQNSFQSTRNFFANQGGGLIISPKMYKKEKRKGTAEFPGNQDTEHTSYPHNMSNK